MSSENKSVWNTLNKTEDWKIPAHIAIIMDGNGRWAKKRGMPRTFGHTQGAKVVEQILEDADALGVRYLTVYAFSTENWSRPAAEVKALMNLLRRYMKTSLAKCAKNNVRIRVIGDKSMLEKDLQEAIANLEKETASNTGISFPSALSGGLLKPDFSMTPGRSTQRFWTDVSIQRGSRIPTCSSGPAENSVSPISCSGRSPIRKCILPRRPGRSLTGMN